MLRFSKRWFFLPLAPHSYNQAPEPVNNQLARQWLSKWRSNPPSSISFLVPRYLTRQPSHLLLLTHLQSNHDPISINFALIRAGVSIHFYKAKGKLAELSLLVRRETGLLSQTSPYCTHKQKTKSTAPPYPR